MILSLRNYSCLRTLWPARNSFQKKNQGALIGKIAHLTSNFRANELQRSVIVANRVKTVNKKIYYSINKIHEAIENGRKITFHYFNYDIKKRKVFRNADGRYTMSPYHLAWEDENYYCIGFYEKYNSVSNFRSTVWKTLRYRTSLR